MNLLPILAMAPVSDQTSSDGGIMGFLPMIAIIGLMIVFTAAPTKTHEKSDLEWLMTFLLCLFGGMLGLHRFYAGRHLTGFIYLISLGLLGLGYAIDFIMILFNRFLDNNGNYIMYSSNNSKEASAQESLSPQQNSSASISVAEEIAKFADLKEKGILTEEEFQAKKQELLDI